MLRSLFGSLRPTNSERARHTHLAAPPPARPGHRRLHPAVAAARATGPAHRLDRPALPRRHSRPILKLCPHSGGEKASILLAARRDLRLQLLHHFRVAQGGDAVSYTHLRAHETVLDL